MLGHFLLSLVHMSKTRSSVAITNWATFGSLLALGPATLSTRMTFSSRKVLSISAASDIPAWQARLVVFSGELNRFLGASGQDGIYREKTGGVAVSHIPFRSLKVSS